MTISVALNVADCIVLGADSAVTIPSSDGGVANVYFSAEKITNLYKGLPIGAVFWGLGGLQGRSITALAKDLRRLLMTDKSWMIDPSKYSIQEVAESLGKFFYTERYKKEYPRRQKNPDTGVEEEVYDPLGFMVAGYPSDDAQGEIWKLQIGLDGKLVSGRMLGPGSAGLNAEGMPEAITRLVLGWTKSIRRGLVDSGMTPDDAELFLRSHGEVQLVHPGMPIPDAIDLVRYLIEVTVGFVRFTPGAPSVHPPVDLAAISYHEGFRWVQRKHYYSAELNPPL
jgi:hypothetical protein